MIVIDEYGEKWSVEKDDPLGKALGALTRLGFREDHLVVPQALLLGGQLVWPLSPPAKPWVGEEFLRWCGLWQTCHALRFVL